MPLILKRHYLLLILFVLIPSLLILGLGQQRIVAYTTQNRATPTTPKAQNYTNKVALFDETVIHNIRLLMPDAEYQQMLKTYKDASRKDFFHADVIVDGVRVNNVGVRLKGNASLRTAMGRGFRGGFGGGEPPNIVPEAATPSSTAKIPMMIKFNQFVVGQRYQGHETLAIRTYGVSYDAAMLNEPLTNYLFRLSGLPSAQTAFTGFQLNEGAEQLYTLAEVIDENFIAHYFPKSNGVLYKSEVGANLQFLGEDPTLYRGKFTQQTRLNDADFAPLIKFIRFLSEADEATFERDLPKYLDVESFATYVALNNLIVNTDSLIGMNNNYYLYYDEGSKRFTILMWDGNESLGKLAGGQAANYDLYFKTQLSFGPRMGGPNTLLIRFMAIPAFNALYETKIKHLYQLAFSSGALTKQIQLYSSLMNQTNPQRNLVAAESYAQSVTKMLNFVTQRQGYLSTTALLSRQSGSVK